MELLDRSLFVLGDDFNDDDLEDPPWNFFFDMQGWSRLERFFKYPRGMVYCICFVVSDIVMSVNRNCVLLEVVVAVLLPAEGSFVL